MKYYTVRHDEDTIKEITKEEARHYLSGTYKQEFVDEIFDNGEMFRLWTPFRDIWTKTDKGLVPMPGLYGIVG